MRARAQKPEKVTAKLWQINVLVLRGRTLVEAVRLIAVDTCACIDVSLKGHGLRLGAGFGMSIVKTTLGMLRERLGINKRRDVRWERQLAELSMTNSEAKSFDKYYQKWLISNIEAVNTLDWDMPWISFAATDILEKFLDKKMRVFEFGMGGSTMFLVRRAGMVYSVEHNADWYKKTEQAVSTITRRNWKGFLIKPDLGNIGLGRIEHPEEYGTEDAAYKGMNFKKYVSVIDQFPDNHFDLVIIDGRSRPACLMHSIAKIRRGGLLVLDNADRNYYLQETSHYIEGNFELIYNKVGPFPFISEFLKTNIWRKRI